MRGIYLILILSIFSCKYEKYEPSAESSPLAECIDGHAKFTLDGKDYDYECEALCQRFKDNFKRFDVSQEIIEAGPK